MVKGLRVGLDEYELLERRDAQSDKAEPVALRDPQDAEAFVAAVAADSFARDELLAEVARRDPVLATIGSPRDKLALAARLLLEGELRLARPERPGWMMRGGEADATTSERPAPAPAPPEKAWLEVRVIDDESGRPYKDVKLTVTLADESVNPSTTNGDGVVEFPNTRHGHAEVTSELPDGGIEQTFAFVGVGERALPEQAEGEEAEQEDLPPGPYRICSVTEHRVRTGETLESVAQRHGLSWQELAKFNWGTAAPPEVNKRLRFVLGCTKKDAAGNNYVFDDADEPGVLYVPRPWKLGGLSTDLAHSLRVRRIRPRLSLRIDDPFLGFVADTPVDVRYADGSSEKLETNEDGVVEVKADRFSSDGNYADVKVTTDLREHTVRVFLVLEHVASENGAWQRLVNLGYVPIEEPKSEPYSPEILAASLEEFQADAGIVVTGKLDSSTQARLASWHTASRSWGEHDLFTRAEPDDDHARSKEEVA